MVSGVVIEQQSDFNELYSDHHTWLLAMLRRRLSCIASAEDLSHDVFVRLLGKSSLPQFDEPRAYLARVAHGLLIDSHRRKTVEKSWLDHVANQPCNHTQSAEDHLIIIDALARIDVLLEKLPSRTRKIFLMSRLEGTGYANIATQLDVSLSTVQKEMTKAIRHCYQVLVG
jgi:RNA polymerase sigma-70 factor (ECF subfamily)